MQTNSDNIETLEVVCPDGMPAFLAKPAGTGPRPVVILMHERYGLVQHTRDQAIRCARDGFITLAPNFFHRHPDQAALNIGDSRYDMTDPEAVEALKSASALLSGIEDADMDQLAVAGYCQTGRHPLVYAAEVPIAAAIVWYGAAAKREWAANERQPETLESIVSKLDCAVFGAFGSDDHIIAVEDVRRLRDTLEHHQKAYDFHIYSGAPHGWLNDTMPGRYRREQAEAGWAHQQAFLKRVLGSKRSDTDDIRWRFSCDLPRDYDFHKNKRQE